MSKKNIVLLIAICGLAALFLAWFAKYTYDNFSLGSVSYYYEGEDAYTVGNAEISPEEVSSVDINWLEGDVCVKSWDGSTIKIEETPSVSADQDKLHYHLSPGGNLLIKFFSSREQSGVYRKVPGKKLTVFVPASAELSELYIYVAAGNISCDSIRGTGKMYLSTEAGNCSLTGCEADKVFCDVAAGNITDEGSVVTEIEAGTAAGNVRLTGEYSVVSGGTKAGDCVFRTGDRLNKAEIKVTTGNLKVLVPDGSDFTARYLVDTGKTDFGGLNVSQKSSGEAVFGEGISELKLEVRIGNLYFVREEN